MNKGSARSGILGISPSRRGEMCQNVIVPESQGSFDKVKNNRPDVNSASFGKINNIDVNNIDGGVAVKSTLFNPDNFSNTAAGERIREKHIDYRGKLENTPEKRALKKVLEIGSNLAAFRASAAGAE